VILLHLLAFIAGVIIVGYTLLAAIRSFVLPRAAPEPTARAVFVALRWLFNLALRSAADYGRRDAIMALYAPIGLILLVPTWLVMVAIGYSLMYWAIGSGAIERCVYLSGSSLLTLGMVGPEGPLQMVLAFSEATVGVILVALLISYLPTMYSGFSRRESAVTMLEVRAGSPPSAAQMIERFHEIHGLDRLPEMWEEWERWFAEVEETHTSLSALTFFRSPAPERSWITASGAVLDAASIALAALDVPNSPEAALCVRSGYLSLRRIAAFFGIEYDPSPAPTDPITILPAEFDELLQRLDRAGVPLKADRVQAWRDYAGWRVNYDRVLVALCSLVMAPPAPWSSDRRLDAIHDWYAETADTN
jgi:hypothetical protein